MATVFTVLGGALGFKRNRAGAHLFKCSRDDGAPTLLLRPRSNSPPLYEKNIEVHVSATREHGLAVTVARADAGSDAIIGDILHEACENVDLARDKKWNWWDGAAIAPAPVVKPEEPASTPVSPQEAKAPAQAAEPAVTSKMDERRVAVAVARRLAPWFAGGFAVFLAVVGLALHYQHAAMMALTPRQPPADATPAEEPDPRAETGVALGERRLPLWDWQSRPPCKGVAEEVDDGCWVEIAAKPPCPKTSYERNGKCWIPMRRSDKTDEPRSGGAH